MTVHVLISGTLFREAESRTSAAGRKYVTATIRAAAADNSSADFWNCLIFSETAAAEMQRLAVGERLAAQGALKVELYEREGQPAKISRTIFVDHVLALRAPPKERKAKAPAGSKAADAMIKQSIIPDATPETAAAGGPAFFDDDLPFVMEWRG
jgi:single-stranded DNA-binding protein